MNKILPFCKECGGKPCICEINGKWAAHCMDCDNNIGKQGCIDYCANSEKEAKKLWTKANRVKS